MLSGAIRFKSGKNHSHATTVTVAGLHTTARTQLLSRCRAKKCPVDAGQKNTRPIARPGRGQESAGSDTADQADNGIEYT